MLGTKIIRNNTFQHVRANRLVSHGKTIAHTLNVKELQHRGEIFNANTSSSLYTPFNHIERIVQGESDTYTLSTPTTPATLYLVEIGIGDLRIELPTLAEGQTCTLGFTNTTIFMAGQTTLLLSGSDENDGTTRYYGPLNDQSNLANFAPLENFLLINGYPGQIMVLYGEGKDGYNNWYALENSFGWFAA